MIYKTLKKVSEYCQLLDKRKYNPSKTIYGVTFTNNDDGTFTANGTATAGIDYRVVSNIAKRNVVAGHKYLMRGCPAGGSKATYDMRLPFLGFDYGNGLIAKLTDSGADYYKIQIIVRAGIVCDNLIFKPQLFDLTEMYGAGNEPTTVEEFREKFPNELYDYKPYCFVKSYKTLLKATDDKIITTYKKSLICTTKNLFDIPLTRGYPSDTSYEGTTHRTFTVGTYIIGMTRNNYYEPYYITNVSVSKNNILFKTEQSGYGVSVPFLLTVGKTYTVSCKADNNFYPSIGISYYKEDGTFISFTESEIITNNPVKSFTVPENTYYTLILFFGRTGNEYTFSNIQLEEGSTATEYHPYGYL